MSSAGKATRLIGAILAFATIVACNFGGANMKSKTVSLHGVTYRFPNEHISAAVIPPEGRLYVHLAPPGAIFVLVLDEWGDRPSPHGPGIPRISRLSDNRFGKFTAIQTPDGTVVCDQGPQPRFNCGILLKDGPVNWAVLFDKEQINKAPEIRAQAVSIIRTYRSDHAERS